KMSQTVRGVWLQPNVVSMSGDILQMTEEELISWEQLQKGMNEWFQTEHDGETEEQRMWRVYVNNQRILWISYLDRMLYPMYAQVCKGRWEDIHETAFYCHNPVITIPTYREVPVEGEY